MRITPLDIRKQEFRKTMRGLDTDEVYAFLTTVAEEYEAVLSDNKRLREKIVEFEGQLKEYKEIEANLRNTLLTAEKVTAEAKENARREASLIVRESEMEAQKAAGTIRAHTVQLRREILDLKKQKDNYLTRLKTLIESHRKVLEGFEDDFAHVDKEIEEIGKKVEEDATKSVQTPRMSRENITEEFAHGPADKVTWGDERRREDEPRPRMPKPDWHADGAPGKKIDRPEDTAKAAAPGETGAPKAQADPVEEQQSVQMQMPHIDTEAIGSFDQVSPEYVKENAAARSEALDRDAESPTAEVPAGETQNWSEEELRSNVARSIEEKLYPDTGANEAPLAPASAAGMGDTGVQGGPEAGAGGSAGTEPASGPNTGGQDAVFPQAGMPQQVRDENQGGVATAVQPEPQVEASQEEQAAPDHWKNYKVEEDKHDWTEYEVPRDEAESLERIPTDSEVEEALSGLAEMTGEQNTQEAGQAPMQQTQPEKIRRQSPAQQAAPSQEPAQARQPAAAPEPPQAAPSQEQGEDPATSKDGSTWSMETLRKNLTNFHRNEE